MIEQNRRRDRISSYRPVLLDVNLATDQSRFNYIIQKRQPFIVDRIDEAVEELFTISHPFVEDSTPEYRRTLDRFRNRYFNSRPKEKCGVWAYFSWRNTMVHLPRPKEYHNLHTSRNKLLITESEQAELAKKVLAIAGLSVGSSVLNMLVLTGEMRLLRLADADTLSITNLNRLLASVCDLGEKKTHIATRRVTEVNPFQKIELFNQGVTDKNIDRFLGGKGVKADLFIEEMDSIRMKIIARFRAREAGIPVIMATDNGDNAFIDVERFDLEPSRPLFHETIPEKVLRNIPSRLTVAEKTDLAIRIVGTEITPRTKLSLMKVGTQIPGFPQLGHGAALAGVAANQVAVRILTGKDMPSGRYEINFEAILDPNYHAAEQRALREELTRDFLQGFELLFGGH